MRSFSFFLLAAWLCLSLGAHAQTTYYVDGTNGDDASDGTQANPVATITQAIDLAVNGDVIQVLAGNYTESIVIEKSLSLVSEGSSITSDVSPLISISASDVSFQGFSLSPVTDNASTGISISTPSGEASDVSILQNTISNFEIGINIVGTTSLNSLNITNNFINGNTNGIIVRQAVQIQDGAISNNNLSNNTDKALINQSNNLVNASANWWGGFSPSDVTRELGVSTPSINVLIDYNPWLNSTLDANQNNSDGFQPLFNVLNVQKQNNNPVLSEAIDALDLTGRLYIYDKVSSASAYEAITINKPVTLSGASEQNPIISSLTLDSDITVSGNITLSDLVLDGNSISVSVQENGSRLTLPYDIASNLASQEGRITGPVATSFAENGQGIEALGVMISSVPEDPLGVVTIERNAGAAAIVNENRGFQSIKSIWDISAQNNNFTTRNVTFQWLDEDDNDVFVDDAIVWKNPGPSPTAWEPINAEDPIDATQDGSIIRSITVGVNSFSQFTIGGANQPLPVELTHFSASLLEPHVELNWETASEINSDFFSVERSQNGIDFSEIGQIKAAGDSDAPLQYRYIDEQAANRLSGSVFYRLRTVDFDGSFEYSDITLVTLSDDDIPMIAAFAREGHPNLKLFTRAIEPGDYTVWITDLNGRKIFEQDLQLLPKESYELGVGHLPQSVYLIRCEGRQLALSTKFRVEEIE